jgi:hypothetical protein
MKKNNIKNGQEGGHNNEIKICGRSEKSETETV